MPDNAARLLANAPVVFVLAAIRFEPLESLPNWMADIQEGLRDHMPLYRRIRQIISSQGFELAIDPPDFDANQPASSWVMSSADGQTSIQVSKSALIVHTRRYSSFSEFSGLVQIALSGLLKHAKRIHVSQVGIRYIDHLRVIDGVGVDKFVPSQLLPHVPDIEGLVLKNATSTKSYSHGEHLLNVRFNTGAGMSVIPDDLMAVFLSSTKPGPGGIINFQTLSQDEGVLDTDCLAADLAAQVMDEQSILSLLDQLHVTANQYFRAVTTSEATDAWNGANAEAT